MSQKISRRVLRYQAVFEPCEEGGFTVTVPKLPGVITEGDSFEEALKNAKDAIKGYLTLLNETKEQIPESDDKTFTAAVEVSFPAFACN